MDKMALTSDFFMSLENIISVLKGKSMTYLIAKIIVK